MIGNWIADIFQPIVDFFNWFFWILIGGMCAFIQMEYDSIKGLIDLDILNAPFVDEAYTWFMHVAMVVLPLILIVIVLISWLELEIDSSILKRWFKSLFTVVLLLSILSPIFDFTGNITESFITSAEEEFQSDNKDDFSVSIANMLVTDTEDPTNTQVFGSQAQYLDYDYINTKREDNEHAYKYSYFSTWLVGLIFVLAFAILLFLTAIKLVVNIWNLVFTKIISPLIMVLKGVDDVFSKQLFQNIFKQAFGIFLLYLLLLLYVDFMEYYITTGTTYNLFQMFVILIAGGWFIFNGDQFAFVGQDVGLTRGSALAAVAAGGIAYKSSSKLVRSATARDVNGNRTGLIGKAGSKISSGVGAGAKGSYNFANNSSFVRGIKDGVKTSDGARGATNYAKDMKSKMDSKVVNPIKDNASKLKQSASDTSYKAGEKVGSGISAPLGGFSKYADQDNSSISNISNINSSDSLNKTDIDNSKSAGIQSQDKSKSQPSVSSTQAKVSNTQPTSKDKTNNVNSKVSIKDGNSSKDNSSKINTSNNLGANNSSISSKKVNMNKSKSNNRKGKR